MSHEQTLAPAAPAMLEARSIVKNYGTSRRCAARA